MNKPLYVMFGTIMSYTFTYIINTLYKNTNAQRKNEHNTFEVQILQVNLTSSKNFLNKLRLNFLLKDFPKYKTLALFKNSKSLFFHVINLLIFQIFRNFELRSNSYL